VADSAGSYEYKQSVFTSSNQEQQQLDGIERRYLTGFADLMLISPWSVASSDEETLELMSGIDLSQVMIALHAAYIASAIRGQAIKIEYTGGDEGLGFTWEFDAVANFMSQNGRDGWIALESMPMFRRHYQRYQRVLDSLPDLLLRVELIDITDANLGKRTAKMTTEEIEAKMKSDAAMLTDLLRNDGYLLHGPEKTIQVHHRQTEGLIRGIEELKRDVLAATDYTETHLWGATRQAGLAGIAQQERDSTMTQTRIRINRCWRPVVQQLIDNILCHHGLDTECTIDWQPPYEGDAREMAETELMNTRSAKIRLAENITSEAEERGRYQGLGRPSPYPIPDQDTAPVICPVDCEAEAAQAQAVAGLNSRRGPDGRFLPTSGNGREADVLAPVTDSADRFVPTAGMRKNANRGLEMRRQFKHGGTIVGVSRARDIKHGRQLPIVTVKRMYSYFSRHAVDKRNPKWGTGASAGYIAWLLWGGDEGFAWCKSIRERAIRSKQW
jgi:hypothetical protein